MAKIKNDKYYTNDELAKYCVEKAKEIIGEENITEWLEPSAGAGAFLNHLPKYTLAYDIEPEDGRIVKQDFLELELEYKEGRCIIGNPPFGDRNNLFRKFYNKSIEIGDYMAFIGSIKLLDNTRQLYKFDLIHSEDLGLKEYNGVKLHCCFNIYKRPVNGLNKKQNKKLKSITLYREDEKVYNEIEEDFKICRMGASTWKILNEKNLRNFKVVVNPKYKDRIIEVLNEKYNDRKFKNISTPYIVKDDIYKYIKERVPEIE